MGFIFGAVVELGQSNLIHAPQFRKVSRKKINLFAPRSPALKPVSESLRLTNHLAHALAEALFLRSG